VTAVLCGALGSGCWVDETGIFDAVWSDDDEMLAIGVFHYEVRASQRDQGSDARKRDKCNQIYTLPSDLSTEPVPLTACESGGDAGIYLMRRAGYLLVNWRPSGHDEIRRFTLDGDLTTVADSREEPPIAPDDHICHLVGIPSPEGRQIAISYQCQTIPSGDSKAQLRIIDADSGTELLPRTEVPSVAAGIWTPAGEFLWGLQAIKPDMVLRWSPGASGLDLVPTPDCTWPPTTSGPVSESGLVVVPGESLEDAVRFEGPSDEDEIPFGCP